MIRWLRVVWPPWWTLLIAAIVYSFFEAVFLLVEWLLQTPFFATRDNERVMLGLMGVLAGQYGLYRFAAFHPVVRLDYRQWLRATPWTSRKPLPLGPVHLVAQDVLMLGVLVALGWPRLQSQALIVIPVFLFTYLIGLGLLHAATGAPLWAYAIGVGVGFMALFAPYPVLFAIAAAASYGCAYLGLRAALARFPWDSIAGWFWSKDELAGKKVLGWPFDRLGFQTRGPRTLALRDTLLTGALAGWWFFALGYHFRSFDIDAIRYLFFVALPALVGGPIRLACYCDGYWPPISLFGRLVQGRWIIPGYDQVFVAPLLALVVAVAAWFVPLWTGVPRLIVNPIALTVTWWILFGMGPSLQTWRLTGNHRITPGLRSNLVTR